MILKSVTLRANGIRVWLGPIDEHVRRSILADFERHGLVFRLELEVCGQVVCLFEDDIAALVAQLANVRGAIREDLIRPEPPKAKSRAGP